MLVKAINKRGEVTPMSPKEALQHAVAKAAAASLDGQFVYWVLGGVTANSFSERSGNNPGEYEVFADGVCDLGKTRIADDTFFNPKKYVFKIHYKSAKDDLGLPDVAVVSHSFELAKNPTASTGPQPTTHTLNSMSLEYETEEEKPQGGKVSKHKR